MYYKDLDAFILDCKFLPGSYQKSGGSRIRHFAPDGFRRAQCTLISRLASLLEKGAIADPEPLLGALLIVLEQIKQHTGEGYFARFAKEDESTLKQKIMQLSNFSAWHKAHSVQEEEACLLSLIAYFASTSPAAIGIAHDAYQGFLQTLDRMLGDIERRRHAKWLENQRRDAKQLLKELASYPRELLSLGRTHTHNNAIDLGMPIEAFALSVESGGEPTLTFADDARRHHELWRNKLLSSISMQSRPGVSPSQVFVATRSFYFWMRQHHPEITLQGLNEYQNIIKQRRVLQQSGYERMTLLMRPDAFNLKLIGAERALAFTYRDTFPSLLGLRPRKLTGPKAIAILTNWQTQGSKSSFEIYSTAMQLKCWRNKCRTGLNLQGIQPFLALPNTFNAMTLDERVLQLKHAYARSYPNLGAACLDAIWFIASLAKSHHPKTDHAFFENIHLYEDDKPARNATLQQLMYKAFSAHKTKEIPLPYNKNLYRISRHMALTLEAIDEQHEASLDNLPNIPRT